MRVIRESEGNIYRLPEKPGIFSLCQTFILMTLITLFAAACTKDQFQDEANTDVLEAAGIDQVIPANLADSVAVDPIVSVTFKPGTDPSKVSASTVSLKKEGSPVPGKITVSGTTATFTPEIDLAPETEYTATVKTGQAEGSDNSEKHEYSWRFKTGKQHRHTLLSVVSTDPQNNATAVPAAIIVTVTFNQELTTIMKNSTSVGLIKGQVSVEGLISFSGNTATFKPAAALEPNTVYTGKVKMGVYHDVDDINKSGDNYYWSFTTGADGSDVKAPAVSSVIPANNATSVAAGSTFAVTFSEPMNPANITATNITLKQGTVAVAGTVTYSGVTATFVPSSALSAGKVYTCTVTAAVKDVAGNALAADYTWSFTTAEAPVLLSFAADVVPVLNLCNDCHKHPWTTSSVASTFYTNLVNGGYINTTSPATSKIYTKLNGGHPGSGISSADINKVLNWITGGANNN
jgi:hypothetical protein